MLGGALVIVLAVTMTSGFVEFVGVLGDRVVHGTCLRWYGCHYTYNFPGVKPLFDGEEDDGNDEPHSAERGEAVELRQTPAIAVGFDQNGDDEDDADEVPENHVWRSALGMGVLYPIKFICQAFMVWAIVFMC